MTPSRLQLTLTPAQAASPEAVQAACAEQLGTPSADLTVVVRKRSIDARRGAPRIRLTVEVLHGPAPEPDPPLFACAPARLGARVIVVGAGPAGYFAALELLLAGLQPVVLERGKDTLARRYDLRHLMQEARVDPDSNYCFGEGGAGTYSDGKLYTRSEKRGDVGRVLRALVEHGARPEILVDSHPHIGSNKLPGVVERLRHTILRLGGEIHFQRPVTNLILHRGELVGVQTGDGQEWLAPAVILATGHSARDIFRLLQRHSVRLEAKPFALGLRVEHPQGLIDEIQYRQRPRDPHLPAASYQVVREGVYSFCMCPGGLIVPAATAPGEIVVNGMSMSGRSSRWANSGVVTPILEEDLRPFSEHGPLAGVALQASIERAAFRASGDGSQRAPAQRLTDFLSGRLSPDLPRCSYVPGLVAADLGEILPARLLETLRHGLRGFGQALRGYVGEEAVVVGVESRTSSPVRIPRTAGLHHEQLTTLYPCGEGAGFAGGIVSAALDGQRVARAVSARLGGATPAG